MLDSAKPRTHTLTLEAPLCLPPESETAPEIQRAFQEAVQLALHLISLGTLGLLCGQIQVTLEEGKADAKTSGD